MVCLESQSFPYIVAPPKSQFFPWRCRHMRRRQVIRNMTKPTKWHVHSTKTQINLGICLVWSAKTLISLGIHAVWSVFAKCLKGSKGSKLLPCGQRRGWSETAMGAHNHFVGLVVSRLNYCKWKKLFCKFIRLATTHFHSQLELRQL